MTAITDETIREQSRRIQWPSAVVTRSGRARCIALVVGQTVTERTMSCGEDGRKVWSEPTEQHLEHVEHYTLDVEEDAAQWAAHTIANFNDTLREGEPARKLIRIVELWPARSHVFTRMPAGGPDGELFTCRCGMVVSGRPSFGEAGDPYVLSPPKDAVRRQRFFTGCGVSAEEPAETA